MDQECIECCSLETRYIYARIILNCSGLCENLSFVATDYTVNIYVRGC